MVNHDQCEYIDIASRGYSANDSFFTDYQFDDLNAIRITESFDFDPLGKQFSIKTSLVDPFDYDLLFLRLPRPLTDDFLIQLDLKLNHIVIINDPIGIINSSSKSFLLNFRELCPPIKLCKSISEVLDFSKKHDLVLKPLREYGGKGLLRIMGETLNDGDRDWNTIEYLWTIENTLISDGYLAMKYLKNVVNGDKRLLVVNGEIQAAAIRFPARDQWLCNVASGGTAHPAEPTDKEVEIVNRINPLLKKNGILIYGADTLEDDDGNRTLSEINTLSIGGFAQAEKFTGKPVIKLTLDKIFEYANARYSN
jgi:glutathione synthase